VRDASHFVLENFSKNELAEVEKILEQSAEAVFSVIRDGIEKAMAQYN
jgi:peptidyl-tRNA hydrolase